MAHPQNCGFSLRAFKIGKSGAQEGTHSAPQPMPSGYEQFPTISALGRPGIKAAIEEGGRISPERTVLGASGLILESHAR